MIKVIGTITVISLIFGAFLVWQNNDEISLQEPLKEGIVKKSEETEKTSSTTPTSSTTTDEENYPLHTGIMATLFWVGEIADASNDYIANAASYWDEYWQEHYGGVDDPDMRCGYYPCSFTPKENPFYVALPYGEYDSQGRQKDNAKNIPWYNKVKENEELLKNRWVEVTYNSRKCFAQLQDVGPFETDDFDYVFGKAKPKNTFGVGAGIDLSPALWKCLGLHTNNPVTWKFIERSDVPEGPWRVVETTSATTY